MGAELIIVNGPLAGTRYALTNTEIVIGRAPNSTVVLNEAEVGWRHCQIRRQGDRFVMTDLRTSLGTYVNGMRSAERWLEDRDQIGVGKTILMFRSHERAGEPAVRSEAEVKPVLLVACSLVFLFRAMAASADDAQTKLLRTQILRLVSDLLPVEQGVLLQGASIAELLARYGESGSEYKTDLEALLRRVCEEGAQSDP
ncbi:MAG TPA: FHA domain-containing protein, partial [Bryobacteraceae bacterium]|nr:FHA domain-containing protein [Bryobacteraceae bacterium]